MAATRSHPLRQRQEEIILGPAANTLIGRRRQVATINGAEWSIQRIASRQRCPTSGSMAGSTVGSLRQITPTGNLFAAGGNLLDWAVVAAVFSPPQHGDDNRRYQHNQQCETFFHYAVSFSRPGVFNTTSRTAS